MSEEATAVRPGRDDYYMGIAFAVRERANCVGFKVGAVLVQSDRVISTGYNGTPAGIRNCDEGGCERCNNAEKFQSCTGYDVCICVHAEQNALLSAARLQLPAAGAILYTTVQPCFGCLKELAQVHIAGVRYRHPWEHPDPTLKTQYLELVEIFSEGANPAKKGFFQVFTRDAKEAWAQGRRRAALDTGHPRQLPSKLDGEPSERA
jgi:dCMP deaminase